MSSFVQFFGLKYRDYRDTARPEIAVCTLVLGRITC